MILNLKTICKYFICITIIVLIILIQFSIIFCEDTSISIVDTKELEKVAYNIIYDFAQNEYFAKEYGFIFRKFCILDKLFIISFVNQISWADLVEKCYNYNLDVMDNNMALELQKQYLEYVKQENVYFEKKLKLIVIISYYKGIVCTIVNSQIASILTTLYNRRYHQILVGVKKNPSIWQKLLRWILEFLFGIGF
jgi:hypothetical protein